MPSILQAACPLAAKVTVDLSIGRVIQPVVLCARERVNKAEISSKSCAEFAVAASEFEYDAVIEGISSRTDPLRFFDRLVGAKLSDRRKCDADRSARRVAVRTRDGRSRSGR